MVRAMMAAVNLSNVTKLFGDRRHRVVAVDNFSLGVEDRGLVVLLGPSGCGKTTTLRLIAGLERVTAGEIVIGGRKVNDVCPRDRNVALVSQQYGLYPHLSVRQNLAFGLRMRGAPNGETRRRVGEVAELLDLEDLLDRKPHALSGGQQQRVALGRAVAREPRVFLLDEPLASLDAPLRMRLRVQLRRRQRELGMTVLYVTHDQQEAMGLADRLVVMKDGRAQQCDRPQAVFERPANRFVAEFVGTPPMNLLDGRLGGKGEALWFECAGGRIALGGELSRLHGRRLGERMALGIRPTGLIPAENDAGGSAISVRVTMLVPRGEQMEVHTRMSDGQEVVVWVPSSIQVSDGTHMWLRVSGANVALFEPDADGVNVAAKVHGVGANAA